MQQIKFFCGDWEKMSVQTQREVFVPAITTQTEDQIAQIGFDIANAPMPVKVFTNCQLIFDAIRLSVKNACIKGETSPVEVIFFNEDIVHRFMLGRNGKLPPCIPRKLFDKSLDLLIELV